MSRLDKYQDLFELEAICNCREPDHLADYMADFSSPEGKRVIAYCEATECQHCAWTAHRKEREILESILNQKDMDNGKAN